LIALGSDKALTGAASNIGGGDQWQFRLRFSAPEPYIQRDPVLPEEGLVLSIPTFDRLPMGRGRAAAGGQIPVPVKVVRVAIPEGVTVSLEEFQGTGRPLKGLRLGSAEPAEKGQAAGEAGPTAGPTTAGGLRTGGDPMLPGGEDTSVSEQPIRLGQVGWFRNQRFVEVYYTPVVMPPGAARRSAAGETVDATFYPSVEASLVVRGARLPAQGRRAAPEPEFEAAYRAAFINYDEGLALRTVAPSDEENAASSGAAMAAATAESFALATTPVYRVGVKNTGVYRLSQPYLIGGSGVAPGLSGADPRTFKLMGGGVEVPIRVVGEADGSFDAGDFVEFFGQAMTGEPDVTSYIDFCNPPGPLCGFPNIFQANDVTDENVYFLFAEPGTRSRIPDLPGTFNAGLPLVTSFTDTVRREFDSVFAPLGYDDPFFQRPAVRGDSGNVTPDPNAPNCGYVNPGIHNLSAGAKWLGPGFSDPNSTHYCPACEPNQLPGLLNVADTATVRVRWRGSSALAPAPDHLIVAQVGTNPANSSAVCFDNESFATQTISVPQSALVGAGFYLQSPGLAIDTTNPKREGAFLDYIEVDYRRSLTLAGNELSVAIGDAARTYQVDGFASGTAADMIVYDLTQTVPGSGVPSPRRVTGGTVGGGAGNFNLKFSLGSEGAPRRFAMAGAGGFRLPASVTEVVDDDLRAGTNQADYVVIGHPAVLDTGPGSPFMNYLSHRAADSGVTTKVVMIDDIYNQFNNGVASPLALRTFLSYAFDNWRGPSGTGNPPAYALVVGDATVDYNNRLARADWVDRVPTFVLYQESSVISYFASDNAIAAFRGADQLPDIHLGRLPVRTLAEANDVFSKMLSYDVNPPAGSWRTRGVFVADQGNSCSETGGFEVTQNDVVSQHFNPPMSSTKLYLDDPAYGVNTCGSAPNTTQFRSDIISNLDAGAAITSYVGHGSFAIWGLLGYFDTNHIASLAASGKPTFLVNENCLAGGFHAFSSDSLGEAFLKPSGKGAIAVFAPAGLSFTFTGEAINAQLYGDLFGLTKERRFGHLITNVRVAIANTIVDMLSYMLMGDPAQRLIIPAPRPPRNVTATAGNGQVGLSWTPGPDPNTLTLVYRTENPFFDYTLLNPGGSAGTSYTDTTVINGRNYYYRLTSVQAGPFEGAPSNYNSDCNLLDPAASGPDCRWARPLNPLPPPAPSGFLVANPGDGNSLKATWTALSEPDIDHYTVHYGTTPGGPYPNSVEYFSTATQGLVLGLTPGTTYHLVMTATNFSGLTSAPTAERTGKPDVFEGANPPTAIQDLQLRQSPVFPDAVEVSWTAPATDIYGAPTSIASYRVYRGTTPTFVVGPSSLIATLTGAASTVLHDRNAWNSPTTYYYLVTAVDTHGFASGAGRELPLGITQLEVTSAGGGMLQLTWPPVTQDVTGALTAIDHYEVYTDTQPLNRGRIDLLTPVSSTTGTTAQVPEGAGTRFISVIVVDARGNKSPF
jgi:fibronectin type 3 domain-containing protein